MRRAVLHVGDALDVLRGMPEASFDACLTDPPYGLSDQTAQDFANRVLGALPKIGLPDFEELEPGLAEHVDLAGVPLDGSLLSRRKALAVRVEARVGMPEGAVDFENGAAGEQEVDAGDEPPVAAADADLPPVIDAEGGEFLGDYVLDLRDAGDLTAGDVAGGGLCQPLAGGIGVAVIATLLPGRRCPLASRLLSLAAGRRDHVAAGDHAGHDAGPPAGVVALARAEARAMLRFDSGRGAFDLLPAGRAGNGNGVAPKPVGAKLVRALPRAGYLPTVAESHDVRFVGRGTDGAGPHFRLWLRRGALQHFKKIIPPGGFMGARWDHGVPSSEVWREVLRVLKPGAFLFAFGGTRTYHRLACAIEDAGFEIRDSILAGAWVYAQGFPKSHSIHRALLSEAEAQLAAQGVIGEIEWVEEDTADAP